MSEVSEALARATTLIERGEWEMALRSCEQGIDVCPKLDERCWFALRLVHAAAAVEMPVEKRVAACRRSMAYVRQIITCSSLPLDDFRRGEAYLALGALVMLGRGDAVATEEVSESLDLLRKAELYFGRDPSRKYDAALIDTARAVVVLRGGTTDRAQLDEGIRFLESALNRYGSDGPAEARAECITLLEWCKSAIARL